MDRMRSTWRGPWLALVGVVVSAVMAGACDVPPSHSLRFGVVPVQDWLPYWVMQEHELAARHGLQLTEIVYPSGGRLLEGIAAGEVDAGYAGTVPLLFAAQRGLLPEQAVVVAANNFADAEHRGLALLAGSGVTTWQDLAGQPIAVVGLNSLDDIPLRARLAREGVGDYSLVEIAFANKGLAVAGGTVAAAALSEPFLTQSLLRGDGRVLDWTVGGPPLERAQYTALVFRTQLYREQPRAVQAFLRAHLQAVRWMHERPAGTRALLTRRMGLSPEVGEQINLLRWPADARNDPAALEEVQALMLGLGALEAPVTVRQLYDEALLDAVLAGRP
jgi:NitT/TauT family transport system substrate-binding protein